MVEKGKIMAYKQKGMDFGNKPDPKKLKLIKEGKIDRLRMKFKAGEITRKEFKDAKKEIQKYIDY
jgi:hypothetical protein